MKSRLLDEQRAGDALFEVSLARHFMTRNHRIEGLDMSPGRHAEFIVETPDFDFEVECKRLRIDTARKIKFKDFCNFMDELIPRIHALGLMGRLEMSMVDRMPTRQELQRERAEQILVSLDHFGPSTFDVTYDWGRIRGKMRRKDGNLVDITHLRDQLAKSKSPDSLAIVYCEGDRGYPTDPIEFVCRCEKASDILHSVYRTLRKAADEQLSQQRAGVLAMYVPDIGDFYGLEKESGLQNMTHYLFQKSNASLAAVIYSSDPKHTRFTGGIDRTTQALCFKNSQCKFAEALEYPYVNDLTTRTL